MIHRNLLLLALFWLPCMCFAQSQTVLRIPGPQSEQSASYDYFQSLLLASLRVKEPNFLPSGLVQVPFAGQGRTVYALSQDELYDVIWTAQSDERVRTLLRIDIPLLRAGLGLRGMLIRRDWQAELAGIKSVEDLYRIPGCSGLHWPDSDIYEHNKLRILRVDSFDRMVSMLSAGRCDYIPLSVFEGQGELAARAEQYPDLVFATGLLLYYPLTMHFYVNVENPDLAVRLSQGMQQLVESGEHTRHMLVHPLTKDAFPLSQYHHSVTLELANPNLDDALSEVIAHYGLKQPKSTVQ